MIFVILGCPEMHASRALPGPARLKDFIRRNLGTDLSQGKGGGGGGFLVKVFLLRLLLSNYYVGSTSPTPSKAEYGAEMLV